MIRIRGVTRAITQSCVTDMNKTLCFVKIRGEQVGETMEDLNSKPI